MSLLEVEKLIKSYPDGTTALHGIDFTVEPGEFVAVIGASGAGKSTLLRCINRLIVPSGGAVRFQGLNVTAAGGRQVRKLRREVGMIFQQFHLIPRVSVLTNVLHGRLGYAGLLGAFGFYEKQDKKLAAQLLDRVGLTDQMYKRADELSGGQQQRVGIARALAQRPKLILADEPIASLDPVNSESIMHYLFTICREEGIACLCNLHQVDVARTYATRIIGISRGRKVFDGLPGELTDEAVRAIYRQA